MTCDVPRFRKRALIGALPILVCSALLVWHAFRYFPFVADDALISYRYAERLVSGQGLTWSDGEYVEGYTNLLWTVGAAAISVFGVNMIDAGRVLGVASGIAIIAALVCAHRTRSLSDTIPGFVGGLFVASSGAIAVWVVGGLEQVLYGALLAWAVVAALPLVDRTNTDTRRVRWVGAPLAGLCLTRPDAPLFVAVIAGTVVLVHGFQRAGWGQALKLSALPVATVLGHLAFRVGYYGDWIPNTARIKAHITTQRFEEGLEYVFDGIAWLWPLAVVGALGVLCAALRPERRGRAVLLGGGTVVWLGYIALVGGDFFPAHRHFAPAVVLLAFLSGEAADWLIKSRPHDYEVACQSRMDFSHANHSGWIPVSV